MAENHYSKYSFGINQQTTIPHHKRFGLAMASASASCVPPEVTNEMIYKLVLATDARRCEDIASLQKDVRQLISLVTNPLLQSQHDYINSQIVFMDKYEHNLPPCVENGLHRTGQDQYGTASIGTQQEGGKQPLVNVSVESLHTDASATLSTEANNGFVSVVQNEQNLDGESLAFNEESTSQSTRRSAFSHHEIFNIGPIGKLVNATNEKEGHVSNDMVIGESGNENNSAFTNYIPPTHENIDAEGIQTPQMPEHPADDQDSANIGGSTAENNSADGVADYADVEDDDVMIVHDTNTEPEMPVLEPEVDDVNKIFDTDSACGQSISRVLKRSRGREGGRIRGISKAPIKQEPGTSASFGFPPIRPINVEAGSHPSLPLDPVPTEKVKRVKKVRVKGELHYISNDQNINADTGLWECVCGLTTNTKVGLEQHIQEQQPPKYECPMCPELFKRCVKVRKHLEKKHGQVGLPRRLLNCKRCLKVFLRSVDKMEHKNKGDEICKRRLRRNTPENAEGDTGGDEITFASGPSIIIDLS